VLFQGDFLAAHRYLEESVTLCRTVKTMWDLALSLHNLGLTATLRGDHTTALALLEECLSIYRDLQDTWGVTVALSGLGFASGQQGDYATARARIEEALALWPANEDKWSQSQILILLGEVLQRQGELEQASNIYVECLTLSRDVGAKAYAVHVLRRLGSVARTLGQYDRAVQLFAAAARWGTAGDAVFETLVDPAEEERDIASLRAETGDEAFETNWASGQAMTLDQAIEYALAPGEQEPAPSPVEHNPVIASPPASSIPAGLTTREVEVLRPMALGHTYSQIAGQLVISPRTVNAHVTSIFSKLGVTSRAAATRIALDHHLA
jgi:DNA-binding CsgD family transcriptional regulator/tetratricopeptide (TPR) repeat protein